MTPHYNTCLIRGLPAVQKGDKWVVISPYLGEIAILDQDLIDSKESLDELHKRGFFGTPSPSGPGTMSDYFQLTLITTSDCNLACRYCFASSGESRVVLESDAARAAVRFTAEKATGRSLLISFFGGEPSLTIKLIKEIVIYAKELIIDKDIKRVRFNITTNGVMSDDFLEFLIAEDFFITLSMDGVPEIQDYQRPLKSGKSSSPYVEKTIRRLVEKKRDFITRMTVTDYSVKFIVPTIEYLNSLGVEQFHCEAINLAGRAILETKGQPMKRPDAKEYANELKQAIVRASELGMSVLNSSYMNLLQPSVHFCDGVGGNRVSLSYTGELTTCLEVQGGCHPTAEYFIVGSYNQETDSIELYPDKIKNICGVPITDQNKDCFTCFAKYVCGGGCPIRNYHTSGDIFVIDPFRCKVIKSVLPFVIDLFAQASENH